MPELYTYTMNMNTLCILYKFSEAEILSNEKFQLGHDIERFYELNQQLTMDDLARRKNTHSQVS